MATAQNDMTDFKDIIAAMMKQQHELLQAMVTNQYHFANNQQSLANETLAEAHIKSEPIPDTELACDEWFTNLMVKYGDTSRQMLLKKMRQAYATPTNITSLEDAHQHYMNHRFKKSRALHHCIEKVMKISTTHLSAAHNDLTNLIALKGNSYPVEAMQTQRPPLSKADLHRFLG
ncbi:hypothetical protein GNI_019200 [Gregarina niphandrodes]|uniref:Uncharacterized protein n=1 Tax=Gregarina niphandrodes TaxID=110365 RepID=A0A023BBW5_GRENI|nr:hypothetical protein GNI_019200 [Gregarina niphandrodes]EZG81335.1 hypothetical protein GNI_019200 [Gregarina niphandrodes]|eukprot:XP_011134230.1 hypothetical protein GNI_019200 [Gregarina niphandrodes]